MFRTILVAYDGSTFAAAALREAGDLAHLCKAELHLLGIVATTGFMALAEGTGSMDVWGMERKNLTTAQDAAVANLTTRGVKVSPRILEGDPQIEIVRYAHDIKADLVVIGHSGKGIVSRWFGGSVGAELLAKLPCSVLVVAGEA